MDGHEQFEAALKKWFQKPLQENPDQVGRELWSGMANVTWYHIENHWIVSYSFRAAGGIIASIRGCGDYLDWYCSGSYSEVSHRMACALRKEGWIYDCIGGICDDPTGWEVFPTGVGMNRDSQSDKIKGITCSPQAWG